MALPPYLKQIVKKIELNKELLKQVHLQDHKTVEKLIQQGADVNQLHYPGMGEGAFSIAINNKDIKMLHLLLDNGGDPQKPQGKPAVNLMSNLLLGFSKSEEDISEVLIKVAKSGAILHSKLQSTQFDRDMPSQVIFQTKNFSHFKTLLPYFKISEDIVFLQALMACENVSPEQQVLRQAMTEEVAKRIIQQNPENYSEFVLLLQITENQDLKTTFDTLLGEQLRPVYEKLSLYLEGQIKNNTHSLFRLGLRSDTELLKEFLSEIEHFLLNEDYKNKSHKDVVFKASPTPKML